MEVFRKLIPYIWPYKWSLLLSLSLVFCITGLELSVPYLTKLAVDLYIVPKEIVQAKSKNSVTKAGEKFSSINNAKPAKSSEAQIKKRILRVNILSPEAKKVVQRHRDFFEVKGEQAVIEYTHLSRLSKEEIRAIRGRDLRGIAWLTLIFLGVVGAEFAFNFFQRLVMEQAGQNIMHDLRMHLFRHIQGMDFDFFNKNPIGRLVTRVSNDVSNMQDFFTNFISFLLKDLFMLLGIALIMLFMQWKLALASFAVLPAVAFFSVYFAKRSREVFRILRVKLAEINTRFSETISGIKIIKLFLHEEKNYKGFRELNHENYLYGMEQIRILAFFMPIVEVLGFTAVGIVIYQGGGAVLVEKMSVGALVAFISYIRMFFRPIRDLTEKFNLVQNALASGERIFSILDKEKKEEPVQVGSDKGLFELCSLKMEDLSFAYANGEKVLKGINLSLKKGEHLAVVGPTGSGKTTLINLLLGFYFPSRGRVLVNGRALEGEALSMFRASSALVMQEPFLFSETIKENILQDRELSDKKLYWILEQSNCLDFVQALPDKENTLISEGGGNLSSGQKQLICIARAFARDPQLLILDEATSAIDTESEQRVQEALKRLLQGRTSITIAHRLSTVKSADRIIVLAQGKIAEEGTHWELLKKQGLYYKMYQLHGAVN